MTISHFLFLWCILAQVHQVDISYFDHIFQPAPNNKYDYSSGGVWAEAGILHIGHDFKDTTRANIFVEGKKELSSKLVPFSHEILPTHNESNRSTSSCSVLLVAGTQCNYDLGITTATINVLGCDWQTQVEQSSYREYVSGLPAAMLEVQITEVQDEITKDRNMPIWTYFQDPPMIQSINMTQIPDEREEDPNESEDDVEDRNLIRFQYDGDLKFVDVTFQEDRVTFEEHKGESNTCYLDKLGDSIDSFHVIEYLKLFQVRVNLWNELFFGKKCNQIDESRYYNVSITNNIGLEQTSGFESFYNGADQETQNALKVCSDLAPPNGEAEGPCIASVAYNSTLDSTGVTGLFATGRPTIYEKYKTRNMHFSVIGQSGIINQYTASIFISGLYSKGRLRYQHTSRYWYFMILQVEILMLLSKIL